MLPRFFFKSDFVQPEKRRTLLGQLFLVLVLALGCGCHQDTEAPAQLDASSDSSIDSALADVTTPDERADAATDSNVMLSPANYCEAVADSFCDFYLRCGRMAVESAEQCRTIFLETCNERYEPVYIALVEAQLLSLSPSGLTACMAHLSTVACSQQIHDLDGDCGGVWVGHQPVDSPCGIGIESFVCAAGSACRLSLDLCGVCKTIADVGDPCGAGHDVVCGPAADCIEGICQANVLPGQACSNLNRCVTGALCVDGTCQPPSFGTTGDACDSSHRCQYRTACVGGSCRDTALLGDSCDATTPCDSGRCAASPNGSTCEPRLPAGQPCSAHADCLSGRCLADGCDAVVGRCFQ